MTANTTTASGARHGVTGLIAALCVSLASYYGVPEVYSAPVCAAIAGGIGSLWRKAIGG